MTELHVSVMEEQVVRLLAPAPGHCIVDATTGAGGHAERLLEEIAPDGELIGLDRDPFILREAARRLERFGSRARLVHARMSLLVDVVRASGRKHVDGVLMDLGVSSVQLDRPERGFSFRHLSDEPTALDMRMDPTRGETAAQLLERLDEKELADVLRSGDVPHPSRVARALRARRPIRTTRELVEAIESVPLPRRRHHPATLVFQALRMAVNEEPAELEAGLEGAVEVLRPSGRLAVLTYHSGEDRCVKAFLAREERGCICPPDLPVCGCGRTPRMRVLARGEGPDPDEVRRNPRARSARLRGGERC
jgi:16S rRNA (cytosine1402-N4)-methyltransferase